VFVPAGQAGTLARQFAERGLDKSGIKLIGPGDIVDDDDLPGTGDTLLGVVTAELLSIGRTSLYAAVKRGELMPIKFGKKTLFCAMDLAAFLMRMKEMASHQANPPIKAVNMSAKTLRNHS
jgi:hypothetical protein